MSSGVITVAFATDHAATPTQRAEMIAMLEALRGPQGETITVLDLCPPIVNSEVPADDPCNCYAVDYPDYATRVAHAVTNQGEGDRADCGVLVCGTGIGMSIAANKVKGVRAALCHDHLTASLCRQHNNTNVLCVGYRVVGLELLKDIFKAYIETPFSNQERHVERIKKIAALESE